MKKFRVDVFDKWYNGNLLNRLYIDAESETEARNKAYFIWERSLICTPLNTPCFNIMLVA